MFQLIGIRARRFAAGDMQRAASCRVTAAVTAAAVFVSGCMATAGPNKELPAEAAKADQLLVVDCLLPGQVRKLGQNYTYLSARRPIKTSAADCEIRGGEYVAYDRADYATSLRIWLPQAQEGDPAAQTYVGEIYEKGLGTLADYGLAAKWYRMAADQGYSRAQINLGSLYERGLGVNKDLTTAMNWYRRSSGLTDGDLEYVTSVEVEQRQAVRAENKELKRQLAQLEKQLQSTRATLSERRAQLNNAQREADALRTSLHNKPASKAPDGTTVPVERETVIIGSTAERAELQTQLEQARREQSRLIDKLAQQQLATLAMRDRLEKTEVLMRQERTDIEASRAELEEARARLAATAGAAASGRSDREALASEVSRLEALVASQQTRLKELEASHSGRQAELEQELAAAHQEETRLKQDLRRRNQEVAALQAELATSRDQLAESVRAMEAKIELTRSQKQALARDLASRAEEVEKLRVQAADASALVDRYRVELAASEKQRDEIQRELRQQKTASDAQAVNRERIESLESRLAQLQGVISDQTSALADHQRASSAKRAELEQALEESAEKTRKLQVVLDSRTRQVEALEAELATSRQRLAAFSETSSKLSATEKSLQMREQEIAQQQAEIAKLEAQLRETERQLTGAKTAAAESTDGPKIEIIEPPLAASRGGLTALLRKAVSEIDVVGRVAPQKELLVLSVNNQTYEPADNGLFRAKLPVRAPETPVTVTAIDKQGNRVSVDFSVVPGGPRPSGNNPAVGSAPVADNIDQVDFGKYYALIIGNNHYQHMPDLKAAANDARAVEKMLRTKYGFKTTLQLDADRYAILSALNKFREELTEKDNFLLYYAGHGHLDSVNLRGYWLPVDSEQESSANWISNVAVTDILNVMSARHILVVADSCYSGALTRSSLARLSPALSTKATAKWYRTMVKARARTVLTSGALKPVLDLGGGDNHSVFARAFLDVLGDNQDILEGFRLYRGVYARVTAKAASLGVEQDPQYVPIKFAGHEAGEFFFLPVRRVIGSQTLPVFAEAKPDAGPRS